MPELDLASLFLLGFLGSGHCVGMCGPLVLALPGASGKVSANLLYHLGRLLTYTLIGAIMGGIGAGIADVAGGAGQAQLRTVTRIQLGFSAAAGLFLLLFGLTRIGLVPEPRWMSVASPSRLPGFEGVRERALVRRQRLSVFLFGLLLGLLPCGLSYAAFARALPSGGADRGALMALTFGLGTVPALLLLGTAASGWASRHRRLSDLLAGLVMVGMGVSLLVDVVSGWG